MRTIVGHSPFRWRQLVCVLLVLFLPVSLWAQDSAAAVLRSNGVGVLVNQNSAPASMALFRDDLVETQKKAVARIEFSGSTADISPETMVQFEGDELVLDHGSLSVNTSRGLRVRVGCVTVTPVNNAEWTHYDVYDLNGKVTASALKSDVYIDSRSNKTRQAKQSTQSGPGDRARERAKIAGREMRRPPTPKSPELSLELAPCSTPYGRRALDSEWQAF